MAHLPTTLSFHSLYIQLWVLYHTQPALSSAFSTISRDFDTHLCFSKRHHRTTRHTHPHRARHPRAHPHHRTAHHAPTPPHRTPHTPAPRTPLTPTPPHHSFGTAFAEGNTHAKAERRETLLHGYCLRPVPFCITRATHVRHRAPKKATLSGRLLKSGLKHLFVLCLNVLEC